MSPHYPVVKELPRCPCGQVHRLSDPEIQQLAQIIIAKLGEAITVSTSAGSWQVPRVWIAAHGLAAADLPLLAVVFGWARIP